MKQEHAQRVAAQALVEQHKQQLADLKLEASILRQASAEHARHASAPTAALVCQLIGWQQPVLGSMVVCGCKDVQLPVWLGAVTLSKASYTWHE